MKERHRFGINLKRYFFSIVNTQNLNNDVFIPHVEITNSKKINSVGIYFNGLNDYKFTQLLSLNVSPYFNTTFIFNSQNVNKQSCKKGSIFHSIATFLFQTKFKSLIILDSMYVHISKILLRNAECGAYLTLH